MPRKKLEVWPTKEVSIRPVLLGHRHKKHISSAFAHAISCLFFVSSAARSSTIDLTLTSPPTSPSTSPSTYYFLLNIYIARSHNEANPPEPSEHLRLRSGRSTRRTSTPESWSSQPSPCEGPTLRHTKLRKGFQN